MVIYAQRNKILIAVVFCIPIRFDMVNMYPFKRSTNSTELWGAPYSTADASESLLMFYEASSHLVYVTLS